MTEKPAEKSAAAMPVESEAGIPKATPVEDKAGAAEVPAGKDEADEAS